MPTPSCFPAAILLSFFISFFGCIYAAPPSEQSNAVPQEIQKALQLPEGDGQTQALRSAGIAWERQDPHAALEWAFNLPTNSKSSLGNSMVVVRAMSDDWGDREPVPATTEWVMGHLPKEGQLTMMALPGMALHLVVAAWARHDPSAASLWAEKQPEANGLRRIAYESIASGWVRKDPASATAWAVKQPGEADRHLALEGVTRVMLAITKQPEIVAAWAEKLPVGDMKTVVPKVAGSLAKTDATKAKAWVNGLPLADTDKAEILGKIK